MKIAIFGSCVSRDTAEFIPDSEVVVYVARHSVTSLEAPHGTKDTDLSELSSAFQKQMVTSDLKGAGVARIVKHARDLELVLIDLVDERRGYWLFPDDTTMTNSLEVEACGAARDARRAGARLVEFGTDEHFELWKSGFEKLIDGFKAADLWGRTILLDIEWAGAVDGAQHPQQDSIAKLGRTLRKLQRGTREAGRDLSKGRGVGEAWSSLWRVKPTEAEEHADRAAAANADYIRYRDLARSLAASSVVRPSGEVRIDRGHKWGPQPFHYRKADYLSIVDGILEQMKDNGGDQP
ncbi:DUF6270 domain-containing protein [Brevibacterium aurantiacum]|uniref:Uncharacterized protein n=1 Tax=Brevibacterium aurantiacum TaxID=273384 RepID=A0A556C982_BREAU|nr:DUF6270 domain-containing protein [Brevibacterium aurantiacum]TSI13940.1 hypothetical protein FO013_16660 [Brevibacterium aurantiacum]